MWLIVNLDLLNPDGEGLCGDRRSWSEFRTDTDTFLVCISVLPSSNGVLI
jgi:hypothetical protein